MIVAMTAMLVSMAELSNVFSVLAVLMCFCAMMLFVLRNVMVFRLHGDALAPSSVAVVRRIPRVHMMRVHIPFTFHLQEAAVVQCHVSSQVPYMVQVLWGVSIRELHLCLWQPWSFLQEQLRAGCLLEGHYQHQGAVLSKSPQGDEVVTLILPQPALCLGTPPRLRYPLVIFLVRTDTCTVHPDETVALVNVVHIRDSVCTLPTSILAQYLKQANGQLSCLKQLYLAAGNAAGHEEEREEGAALASPPPPGDQLCVVCQCLPLSRALLPCRHTCVCASCFTKLERCPLCRSPICSYFCIRTEDYMATESTTAPSPTSKAPPLVQWLQHLNDRLTDFLGFQR